MAKRLSMILPLLALLLITMAAPASAGEMGFKEWGITAFGNLSMDVNNGDLYEGGIFAHVAMPLIDNEDVRLDFRLEGLVGGFWDYGNGVEVAIIPALRLYIGKAAVIPYIEGGIGPSYNSLDIQELGIGFNFLSYGGVGLRIPLQNNVSIEFGYRLRHISNAGLDERNHGVTSNQAQFGIAWAF
ncbi:MAG: acyloxyacyl hydrolase [Proteobacteria bacterium]|nr:acyloxyacyl hydrolase [Pseudomonadota bacterium]